MPNLISSKLLKNTSVAVFVVALMSVGSIASAFNALPLHQSLQSINSVQLSDQQLAETECTKAGNWVGAGCAGTPPTGGGQGGTAPETDPCQAASHLTIALPTLLHRAACGPCCQ